MTGPEESGVISWLETFQYLLLNYAPRPVISSGIKDLRVRRQLTTEDELTYATCLDMAPTRVGNVYPSDKLVSMYVHGLPRTIGR